jgi:hypothetical protein
MTITNNSLYENLPFDMTEIKETISKGDWYELRQMRDIMQTRLRKRKIHSDKDRGQKLLIKRINKWVYLNDVVLPDEFVDYLNDCDFEVDERIKQRNQQSHEVRRYAFDPVVRKLKALYIESRAIKLYPNSVE